MISETRGAGLPQPNHVLLGAITKLAVAGEQAGFSVEEMIALLKTGVSVETLLDLVCRRLGVAMTDVARVNQEDARCRIQSRHETVN